MTQHTLFVCESCRFSTDEKERDGLWGGVHLINHLRSHISTASLQNSIDIQPARCMAACGKACVIGFAAPGKFSYVFGSLSPIASGDAIAQFSQQYIAASEGRVPYQERPEILKPAIISVMPPVMLLPERWNLSCSWHSV